MAILQISKIQQRSGNLVDLPQLDDAEFGWATDSKRLFIGKSTPNENIEVLTSYSSIDFSQINGVVGNININPVTLSAGEVLVYDGTNWVNRGGDAGGLINLGNVSNVKITGGAIGYVLETDGTGNLSWTPKSSIVSFVQQVVLGNGASGNLTTITTTQDNFFVEGAEVTITNVPGTTQLNGNSYFVGVESSNTFALYTDSGLTVALDATGYGTFPYATVSATDTVSDQITVSDATPFTINDPIVFGGNVDTANTDLIAGQTYYVKTKDTSAPNTWITISETLGGTTFSPRTQSGLTGFVYTTGGRVISSIGGAGGTANAGGSTNSVQYNNSNLLDGDSDFTWDFTNKILTVNGNANVGNLNSSSLVVSPILVSNVLTGTAPPLTVSSTDRVANLNVSYANVSDFQVVTAQTTGTYFPVFVSSSSTGNRALGANANISFNAATGNLSVTLLNITANANAGNIGTSGVLVATGNITGGNLNTAGIANIGGNANVTGNLNVTANANITSNLNANNGSIGNLLLVGANANVTGNLNVTANANITSNLNANNGAFGNLLSVGSNLTVTANLSANNGSFGNLLTVGANANVTGNLNVTANANITANMSANNISVGNVLTVGANANVTGNLNVTANANITGVSSASRVISTVATGTPPLTVTSTTRVANLNVDQANVADFVSVTSQSSGTFYPVFINGSSTANYALAANSGISANLANGSITATTLIANVTGNVTGNVSGNISGTIVAPGANTQVIFNDSGNANATSGLTFNKSTNVLTVSGNVSAGNVSATLLTGTLATAAQPNVTSVGTLTSLAVTGNAIAGNVYANSGTIGAQTLKGEGGNISNIQGANVSGTVATATTAGTVTTAAQPNITSVGTLSVLTVSGALTSTQLTTGTNSTPGNITGNWTLTAGSRMQATYADLAEYYEADETYEPGTVLMFGGEKEVTLAENGTNKVAGVVSTNPAYVMNSTCPGLLTAIALQGRVPCKVRGNIKKGDMLISSGNGFASSEQFPAMGTVIGKALRDFEGHEGIIEVAVGRL
jgi:hypothetical protein